MKVLIIRTYPDQLNINSYNVQEIGLANSLIRKGIQCDIVMYLEHGCTHTENRPDGIKIYWIKGHNILKNGFFPHIYRIMKEYDVIQVHEYDQLQSWLIYTFHNKKSNVVMYHGPYYDSFNKGYNFKCNIFDHVFLPWSRAVKTTLPCIVKSPLAADFLNGKGFDNTIVAGVGLDITSFEKTNGLYKCESVIEKRMPSDKINIIYVGKLEERRNSVFLLNIIERLSDNKNLSFTIVGNGEAEYVKTIMPEIEKLQSKGILQYYEKAKQNELAGIYQKADIMLFPTNYDIFGMVLMEAMYFGVVCVSSLNGGSSCLITDKEDGLLMDSFDAELWIHTIQSLVESKKLKNMSKKAEAKIREHFLWDTVADKFIDVYKSI